MNLPTNVQYDTDQTSAMTALLKNNKKNGTGQGGIIGFIIRKGWVKNEKHATYLLIGFLVVILFFTFYLFYQALKKPTLNPIIMHKAIK